MGTQTFAAFLSDCVRFTAPAPLSCSARAAYHVHARGEGTHTWCPWGDMHVEEDTMSPPLEPAQVHRALSARSHAWSSQLMSKSSVPISHVMKLRLREAAAKGCLKCLVPGCQPPTLSALLHRLSLTISLGGRYCPHVTDENTEAQSGKGFAQGHQPISGTAGSFCPSTVSRGICSSLCVGTLAWLVP